MAQAMLTPGNGLPVGAAIVQPSMAGQAVVMPVKIMSEKPSDTEGYDPALSEIAARLGTLAGKQVTAKSSVERRWLDDVRAYHGIYESSLKSGWENVGQSTAYVKATRAKTVALEARLVDLIFPTDDRNWGIEATPVPKLAAEKQEAEMRATTAAQQATQAEADGDIEMRDEVVAAGTDQAQRALAANAAIADVKKAAKAMQEEMDDQLIESHYPSESRKAIHDACLLGTGLLKGPVVNDAARGKWLPGEDGEYALTPHQDKRPKYRYVDPWSFFPDMSASSIDEAEFTFERYLWTRSDLRKMVKSHAFDPNAVRELLRDSKNKPATSPSLSNLVSLRSLTGDGQSQSGGSINNRYIGWEYHGPLECDEIVLILNAMGREADAKAYADRDDPLEEHRVVVYFCDDVILKIAPEYPLDSGETLYSLFNVEEAEGTMFGYGVPYIMRDSQDALNAAWRMALDNGALSIGPQAIMDKAAIEPSDGSWTFRAKKVWWQVKGAINPTSKPIEFFNVPNNMGEIKMIIELATIFIDMETGIPQPQQGEQGAHTTNTVGGMAILQNAANIIFRRIVKNYDDQMITPSMRRLYDWNMQFNPRKEIKGDMQIDARGTSVLLLKEVQATNLLMIVTQLMANPNIAMMLKAYPAVEKLFQSMMIKPSEVMVTSDQYEKALQEAASQPPPPSPAEITAQARVATAEIGAQVAALRDETARFIAENKERLALIELASDEGLTIEQLKTELAKVGLQEEGKERRLVSEAAIDRKNAQEARQRGEEAPGSGGAFNAGDDQKRDGR